MKLSTTQLEYLRTLDPADIVMFDDGDTTRFPVSTMRALKRRGLAAGSRAEGWTITKRGTRISRGYVERTGNGPERLKALLRF